MADESMFFYRCAERSSLCDKALTSRNTKTLQLSFRQSSVERKDEKSPWLQNVFTIFDRRFLVAALARNEYLVGLKGDEVLPSCVLGTSVLRRSIPTTT